MIAPFSKSAIGQTVLDAKLIQYPLWMALFGMLLGLSAPGYNHWWLAWLSIAPALLWAYRGDTLKQRVWGGFWFGFCFQAIYCAWFFDLHPLTWLGFDEISSRLVTLAGWLLIGAEGGLLTSLFFGLAGRKQPFVLRLLGLPLAWISLFALLNATPLALPWGLLEYTQAGVWPLRWLAGQLGGLGVTALLVFFAILLAESLQSVTAAHSKLRPKLSLFSLLCVPAILALLNALPEPRNLRSLPMPLAIVQANLPIELIRSGQLTLREIDPAYLQPIQTRNFPAGSLILLPEEGAVPGLVNLDTPLSNPLLEQLAHLAQQKSVYIAVGISSHSSNGRLFNSIALLPGTKTEPIRFYHKRRLVPFGEYTPYQLGAALSSILQTFQVDYSAPYSMGQSTQPLVAGKYQLGGLVCFELIDGWFSQAYRKQNVELLINLSNLGWFHQNPLIEAQFLAIGQLRAAESKTPLAIASNTGISAILSSTGAILKQSQPLPPSQARPKNWQGQVLFYNN
jgi:apolipoprotein N-acyltransferase